MIIHIDGAPGSGKTYICSKVKNFYCVDTDDIVIKARKKIDDSQKSSKKIPRTIKSLDRICQEMLNEITDKHRRVLIVGTTMPIEYADLRFFIKIEDMQGTFKRLILRELDKIVKNEDVIKKTVKKMDDPKYNLIELNAKMSDRFPPYYENYVRDYKIHQKYAKRNGYIPMTQSAIIKFLNSEKVQKAE